MSAQEVFDALKLRRLKIATAESCTGGMIAAAITDIPGSSDVFDRGFVTYSNSAKSDMLGVPADLIAQHGAVSKEVARAMAEGAIRHSIADIAVSVTGVAGPGGGSATKPVGTVHFCIVTRHALWTDAVEQFGDLGREGVRRIARDRALQLVVQWLVQGEVDQGC